MKTLQVGLSVSISWHTTVENSPEKLQDYEEALSYATDAWTSPNHKVYVAVSIHFEQDGVAVSMLLDIIEVACSHSGLNLAAAFAKILDDFGISDKVCKDFKGNSSMTHSGCIDPLHHL